MSRALVLVAPALLAILSDADISIFSLILTQDGTDLEDDLTSRSGRTSLQCTFLNYQILIL